jgi:hypothetical protein
MSPASHRQSASARCTLLDAYDPDLKRFYRRKLVQNGLGKAKVAVARKLGIRLLKRAGRASPALSPERVALGRVPLGQSPSLHRLRCRFPGLVRRLPAYFGTVRHGVSDRAGSWRTLRWRCTWCGLPLTSTTSASRSTPLSRWGMDFAAQSRPASTPVNASPSSSRTPTDDSGPLWVAIPSTYETFVHNTLPVLTGARRASCRTAPVESGAAMADACDVRWGSLPC